MSQPQLKKSKQQIMSEENIIRNNNSITSWWNGKTNDQIGKNI